MSAIANTTVAIVATALLFGGLPRAALIAGVAGTQIWRFLSEFLRDDDRGNGIVSPYQKMSLLACSWGIAAAFIFGDGSAATIDVLAGLEIFRSPITILSLQVIFFGILIFTGLSRMTEAVIHFSVRRDRI